MYLPIRWGRKGQKWCLWNWNSELLTAIPASFLPYCSAQNFSLPPALFYKEFLGILCLREVSEQVSFEDVVWGWEQGKGEQGIETNWQAGPGGCVSGSASMAQGPPSEGAEKEKLSLWGRMRLFPTLHICGGTDDTNTHWWMGRSFQTQEDIKINI